MSFFEPDELILYYYGVFAVFAETDAWPHEFHTSNGSVHGHIIGLIHTWNSVFFYNFRNTESSCKFWQRELNTYMIWSPVATTVGRFNSMRQDINKHSLLPVLSTLSLSLSFIICMFPPGNIHSHWLYYALCVPAFIQSFNPSLAVNHVFSRSNTHQF